MNNSRRQIAVLMGLVVFNALLAVLYYLLLPPEGLVIPGYTQEATDIPAWLLGLGNAGIVLVLYTLAGLAGYWFARRLGLPGIYRPGFSPRDWLWMPLLLGAVLGVILVAVDRLLAPVAAQSIPGWQGFPHPPFPLSIIASATAGIGEEILFRGFVLGLWAYLLNLLLRRWGKTTLALWIANVIAAIAFTASHAATAMLLTGASTPAEIPPVLLVELLLINGAIGLVAGQRNFRDGLVAAIGVHFWTDIVWHVLAPLVF